MNIPQFPKKTPSKPVNNLHKNRQFQQKSYGQFHEIRSNSTNTWGFFQENPTADCVFCSVKLRRAELGPPSLCRAQRTVPTGRRKGRPHSGHDVVMVNEGSFRCQLEPEASIDPHELDTFSRLDVNNCKSMHDKGHVMDIS